MGPPESSGNLWIQPIAPCHFRRKCYWRVSEVHCLILGVFWSAAAPGEKPGQVAAAFAEPELAPAGIP